MEANRNKDRRFPLRFTQYDMFNQAMAHGGGGIPIYCRNTEQLIPKPGELWLVALRYVSPKKLFMIVRPIRQLEEKE